MAQHAGKILGYRQETLQFLNLNNTDHLYDTYQVIINEMRSYLMKEQPHWEGLVKLLNRKVLKNLVMTSEYGVTRRTAWNRYQAILHKLIKTNNLYTPLLDKNFFDELYNILDRGLVAKLFFKKTQKQWLNDANCEQDVLILADLTLYHRYIYSITRAVYYDKEGEPRTRAVVSTILS